MASDVAARSPLQAALPDYELLGELGRGAMGVVLAARHRSLDRLVAIKELPLAFATDESVRQRFLREAQTLASLNHPHVVQVFDFVDRGGHLALVMERLQGGTVWSRFTTDGITAPMACGLVLSAAAGLDHAHRHGVLHRDVKPENLMFTERGQVKVTDFGIAKVMGGERTLATADGAVLGTPAYMAPEQAEGLSVGPPADVYACGTILYELLSGQLPFARAATPMATLIARIKDDAPPLADRAPMVPGAVADVADIALAREVDQRFPTVEDFAVALGQAAALAWGPNWLTVTGLSVTGSEAIEWAARSPARNPARSPSVRDPSVRDPSVRNPAASEDGECEGGAGMARRVAAPATVVDRPDLSHLSPSQLIDVAQVRRQRGSTGSRLVALALAVGLALATVGLALTGRGGSDPAAGVVDFSRPFLLRDLGSGSPSTMTLRLSVLGLPLGQVEAPVQGGTATVDPKYLRWTTAGPVDAVASIKGQPSTTTRTLVAGQRWLTTAPMVVVTLMALFGLATLSSNLSGLRRRRSGHLGVGPLAGLVVAGAVLGLSASGLAWVVADVMLRPAVLTACAGLGAAACLSLGMASRRRASWS